MIRLKLYAHRSALGGDAVFFLDHTPPNPVARWFWNIDPEPVYAINVLLHEVTNEHREDR